MANLNFVMEEREKIMEQFIIIIIVVVGK